MKEHEYTLGYTISSYTCFCEAGELDEALKILQYRVEQGDMDISANVWYYVLDACSTNYHVSILPSIILNLSNIKS